MFYLQRYATGHKLGLDPLFVSVPRDTSHHGILILLTVCLGQQHCHYISTSQVYSLQQQSMCFVSFVNIIWSCMSYVKL